MIGVAATLCNVHPQTLRQYERLGLVVPQRAGAKNRLYSENDIHRVRQIQRLTQEMGVNLAGVDLILRLLDDMEEMRREMEQQMCDYAAEAERMIVQLLQSPTMPLRKDERILPVPTLRLRAPKTDV